MNILVVYSRDIDINDSGGARTTIQLLNYLVDKKGYNCYITFKIKEGGSTDINYSSVLSTDVKALNKIICEKKIEIIYAPEAVKFANICYKAVKGTNCKVVTALHNMPGYEKIGLYSLLTESLKTNDLILKRFRALFLLLIFPIFKFFYVYHQKYLFKRAYNKSDCLLLLSKSFFQEFKKQYRIKDISKLADIGNGTSFPFYASSEDVLAKKKILLYVGRMNESQKRVSLIIKAWSFLENKYPDWKLNLVGSGRSKNNYIGLVKKLKLKSVIFYENQPPLEFYKESSIFLMTSAFEGWGMTIIEAQQMGCVPIVMNTFSSLHELIDSNENGIIVNDELADFCNSISWLIENKEIRQEMAIKAIENSKRFEPSIIYEKYAQLFQKLKNEI
jgi:glycosyltransferase involved in cell wall biosynthesis